MAKKMDVDQFAELDAAVTRALPRDMDVGVAQGWIMNQSDLAKVLRKALMPVRFTAGGRTYEVLTFLRGENSVLGHTMVERAKKMNAHQGADEREHLCANHREIPRKLRDNVAFVFTDDMSAHFEHISYLEWLEDAVCWSTYWRALNSSWDGRFRLLRRVD